MKKHLVPYVIGLSAILLITGCIGIGTGPKAETNIPTKGQQLVDLKKARDAGAISEPEYQEQRAKVLGPF